MNFLKYFLKVLFFLLVFNLKASSDIIEKINIEGNKRISSNTIILFTEVNIGQEITDNDLNPILNNLYNTSYFNDVRISLKNNILNIFVEEFPIIQKINYNSVKSNTILEKITEGKLLKDKSPYINFSLNKEKERLLGQIKELGYYRASIETTIETLDENLVNINFDIKLGDKSKIKKITFIGNKVFKDSKLKRLIASSEYKFWKIISGRKYLNENLVKLDERLLKNYYQNNGYYNVKIYSSFAKLVKENEFELIFNIDSNQQYFFGNIKLDLPPDFDEKNFLKLEKLFSDIKGEVYSINQIDKILDEIDLITLQEQYQFINATVEENLESNNINLIFKIKESDKYYVEKINIYGNNVTQENVIRNQLELDEGDPFNEILLNKSINNIKSLNFFKYVDKFVEEGASENTKILNLSVEEKPTGEISATAGFGTSGGSIGFGIKENNFLGKGLSLDSNFDLNEETFRGKFTLANPNYNNSDKSIYLSAETIETDNFKTFGYKTNKKGINIGTNFEYLNDLRLGIGTSNFYEVIKTNNTASQAQQDQEGNYWDSFVNFDFIYDKRNQKFQTTSGFRSFYSIDLPIISDNETLKNYYSYSQYFELFDQNISSFSLMLNAAKSISNK